MASRASSLLVVVALLVPATLHAREVDQFTDRMFQLRHLNDASPVIDARMNAMLKAVAAELNAKHPKTPRDRDDIIYNAFQGGGSELVAQIHSPFESWVRDDAAVELFWVDGRGIYGGDIDYDDMGFAWYIEVAPVIRLGPLLVGIDKLGHFLGQGWFYYREDRTLRDADPRATEDELHQRLLKYGHDYEVGYLGLAGTGVYSYADLAANWQGLLFYRALFAGPNPYLVAANGRYRQGREFHILDYATDAWDEVANPSRPRTDRFFEKVARYLRAHVCAEYRASPSAFLNASGRTQDPHDYLWSGAVDSAFACKRRFALAELCR